MLAPEVISNLKMHLACIQRQHTPECKRECDKCDVCLRKNATMETLETAIKVLEYVEQKRAERKNEEG